jgi:hypothetical protein
MNLSSPIVPKPYQPYPKICYTLLIPHPLKKQRNYSSRRYRQKWKMGNYLTKNICEIIIKVRVCDPHLQQKIFV